MAAPPPQLSTDDLITGYLVAEESAVASNSSPAQIAERISAKNVSLLGFIKMLGPALVAESPQKRARGVGLMAATLSQLPPEAVNRQEARHLVDYLTNETCLSAPETLVQALDGLSALAKLPVFGQGDTFQVVRALFKHIDMRTHHQAVRYVVYQLVDLLMSIRRDALKAMGSEFLKGYCALAEGEKDPRNLKMAFSLDRILLLEFDIQECIEDLFDVTFCYFPITFSPPPDDPYGITSEELQADLRTCLASTPLFGPLALPLVLDKLQASTRSAKSQSLEVICTCFPVYGKASVDEYAKVFWEALNLEVFNATDKEMESLSIRAMRAFLGTLYPDPVTSTTALPETDDTDMTGDTAPTAPAPQELGGVATMLKGDVLYEVEKAPDKTSAQAATKILGAALGASGVLCAFVLSNAFPSLVRQLQDPEHASVRPNILNHLSELLEAVAARASTPSDALQPLVAIKAELISIFASASQVPATAVPGLHALTTACKVSGLCTAQDRSFIISCFNQHLTPTADSTVTAAALSELSSMATITAREICDQTLPQLYGQLPDALPSNTEYISTLNALGQLCTPAGLFESLVIRSLTRLDHATSRAEDAAALYAHHLLVTLRVVANRKLQRGDPDLSKASSKLVSRLFGLFIRGESHEGCWKDSRLVFDASEIVALLVRTMDERQQQTLMQQLNAACHNGNLTPLLGASAAAQVGTSFKPFDASASASQANVVILYASALQSIAKEAISMDSLPALCQSCWQGTRVWTNELVRAAGFRILALSVNKRAEGLESFLADVSSQSPSDAVSVQNLAWIARGLVTRTDSRGFALAERLLGMCEDPDLGPTAARCIGVVAKDKDGLLTKENKAVVRLLYRQRLCSTLLRLIVSASKAGDESAAEANRLIALSVLLRNMPKQMVLTELPKCMTLLLRAMEIPDPELCAYVVDTLGLMTAEATQTVTPHSSSLILAFVKAATTSPSPKLRSAALRALSVFPETVPYLSLQPHKVTVLKGLSKAVDDRKKSVRKDAVDCREAWYRLSAP